MEHNIRDTGITIGYEPTGLDPVVDIVFVHGLQGHPYRTWRSVAQKSTQQAQPEDSNRASRNPLRRAVSLFSSKSSRIDTPPLGAEPPPNDQTGDRRARLSPVFWPTDLLPSECPNARVLLYGYDTKVTKFAAGAPNKNSIFSHGKDFLFALDRERQTDRPLIFVAHSLGGIIVKEMLSASSTPPEPRLSNIVESTAAIIFLGTPHRGSPGLSSLAEWAQLAVGAFMLDSSAGILDALGLKNTDLERAQESFSSLWRRYGFCVKTFQEGLGLTGLRLGIIGNKVVPDHSSLIGDERERAETIQANHMGMCRYTGNSDPNYRKVAGELGLAYLSILQRDFETTHPFRP